ncbi:MAG: thiamine phosphate synthase [Planctomycetota bacterium]
MTTPGPISPDRFRLMLITDARPARGPLAAAVIRAVSGGVTIVQVREPDPSAQLALARELRDPLRDEGALLVVNDRLDVARDAGADGVHLKRSSVPPREAREHLGPDAVIGISTHTPEEVDDAFRDGADYVVFGPVFATPSKAGIFDPRGPELYHRVAREYDRPVLALGGIDEGNVCALAGGPVPGVAAIRGLLDVDDPARAARALCDALDRIAREDGAR